MHQFTDTAGRVWEINLTVGAVKRVKSLVGVNLLDPLSSRRSKKGRPRPPLVTRLQLDPELLVNVIFALVKSQADEQGVTDEQFGEALGAEAAYAAWEAFMQEWRGFFLGLRRETEARAIEANADLVTAEDHKSVGMIEIAKQSAEAVVERERQRVIAKMEALGRGPSETSTDSPESSASTPPD